MKFAHAGKRGLLTYLEKTLQESLKYQPETYELETENGVTKYKAFLIACGNASQYGNNAYIAPQATLTDGLLDVTILEPFTVLDVPSLAFQLFNKTIDQNSRIKTFRCRRLCIRRTAPGVVHFDGDPMETDADVNIELIQRGLRVVVPQAAEKDAANVLQRAQEYMNGIKLMNEAIVDNITDRNKKILKKLTKRGNKFINYYSRITNYCVLLQSFGSSKIRNTSDNYLNNKIYVQNAYMWRTENL